MDRAAKYVGAVGLMTASSVSAFDVKAWQKVGAGGSMEFPEAAYSDIAAKPNIGISFSGGGDRAFTASIGYLAGAHELGLIENIKYMVGVSGGSWATMVYSYYQDNSVSDDTMLGPVVMPEDIVRSDLQEMEAGCVRSFPSTDYKWLSGYTFDDNMDGVQYVYLEPSGIERGSPFSYNDASIADIKSRNPELADVSFHKVRGVDGGVSGIDPRPYPIAATTMIGPYDMLPAGTSNREYTVLEFSPLSVGVVHTGDITYVMKNDEDDTRTLTVGGLIEPYAFGGAYAPDTGLGANQKHGRLMVPDTNAVITDLALAVGSSSYAPGCMYAASSLPGLQNNVGIHDYFSPSYHIPSQQFGEMALADGAGVQNTNVISLLQRNVKKMVLFVSTSTPMRMSADWNPETDTLSKDYVDFTIPALFGHFASDIGSINEDSFDLEGSHVFAYDEWVPLAKSMQAKQAEGKGIVVSTHHTTVANERYGIVAGTVVEVVWVYLGRSSVWESQLSAEMQDLVIPESDAEDLANTRNSGPFDKFPHYTTTVASINKERANLLADYTGWLVHEHKTVLQSLMAYDQSGVDGSSDQEEFYETGVGVATFASAGIVLTALIAAGFYFKTRGIGNSKSTPDSKRVEEGQEMTSNPVFQEGAAY